MPELNRCIPTLGTYVEISLSSPEHTDDELIDASILATTAIQAVQSEMSFHSPDSLLTKINSQAHLHPIPITPSLHKILTFAKQLHKISHGLFDPTIAPILEKNGQLPHDHLTTPHPDATLDHVLLTKDTIHFARPLHIDLGGIAKGYAVDQAIQTLPPEIQTTINAGGDIRTTHPETQTLHLNHPADTTIKIPHPFLAPALATSASYYHDQNPIIDPLTKNPSPNKNSITIFAQNCLTADALTKLAFLLPPEKFHPILKTYQATAVTINQSANITTLSGT